MVESNVHVHSLRFTELLPTNTHHYLNLLSFCVYYKIGLSYAWLYYTSFYSTETPNGGMEVSMRFWQQFMNIPLEVTKIQGPELPSHYFPNKCLCVWDEHSDLCNMQKKSSYFCCFVRFEVPNIVITKIPVFWVVTPCGLVDIYQWYEGMCSLHPQETEHGRNSTNGERGSTGGWYRLPMLGYSSALNMEVACLSKTRVMVYQTI